MPIYDFKCDKCEHEKEQIVNRSIADTVLFECEKCGGLMRKKEGIYPATPIFSGKGFPGNDMKGHNEGTN